MCPRDQAADMFILAKGNISSGNEFRQAALDRFIKPSLAWRIGYHRFYHLFLPSF
jgi:hypothetical protein